MTIITPDDEEVVRGALLKLEEFEKVSINKLLAIIPEMNENMRSLKRKVGQRNEHISFLKARIEELRGGCT